jgi:benzoyl-CoA reductase subunit A
VILDEEGNVVGRGITNSRSNYDVACAVVRDEAFVHVRFSMLALEGRTSSSAQPRDSAGAAAPADDLELHFRRAQYLDQLERLRTSMHAASETPRHRAYARDLGAVIDHIADQMCDRAHAHFAPGAVRKSDFFRDLASSDFMQLASEVADPRAISFELLCSMFDAAILVVENSIDERSFERHIKAALASSNAPQSLRETVDRVCGIEIVEAGTVGTGYGRQRLPFPKEQIRSEILCHGLGAHALFPNTRTVLDIGGQDTKAIQVDANGIVTSFQMNDRCAAGCGRYLGYIADEMNLALHELGPLAQQSRNHVKINSTCTVFAGAELRDRLALGQKREDILAGLHRAIILRAMSLLARSGGIDEEFTFTGGVARNAAAVDALRDLIGENYGERTLNISADSIYTGALGAALFAQREQSRIAA